MLRRGWAKEKEKKWFKLTLKGLWKWLKGPAAWSVLWLQVK